MAYPPKQLGELMPEGELMRELECRNLYPNQARFVHGNYLAPAKIILVSALKGKKADFSVASPLAVYNEDGTYSQEAENLRR